SFGTMGSEGAKLGGSMSRVMLGWPLMAHLVGPANYPTDQLHSSLVSLKEFSNANGLPAFLVERISSLDRKLELAEKEDLWQPQPGYWDFSESDESLNISGASLSEEVLLTGKENGIQLGRKMSMKYLNFPERKSEVVVDLTEQLLSPPLENFTIEFWVRPEELKGTGSIILCGNWKLNLTDDQVDLVGPQGNRLISGKNVLENYWTHISLTSDGEEAKLHRNGTVVGRAELPGPLIISQYLTLGKGFVGDFDELRINSRSVDSERLNFDRPINYLLGFPVIDWVRDNFSSDKLWRFYAGWLVTNLSLKRDNEEYSIKTDDLLNVADFLLGKVEDVPPPPDSLPDEVITNLERLEQLGENDELSSENALAAEEILENLISFFDV
ncbi:MAG: LamG domain-containing protein, partial [Candidatus Bipolaricaulota bacterium]